MPHKLFDLKKVCPVFVKMCSVCMAKCMAGDPPGPSKHVLMLMDMAADQSSIDTLTQMAGEVIRAYGS